MLRRMGFAIAALGIGGVGALAVALPAFAQSGSGGLPGTLGDTTSALTNSLIPSSGSATTTSAPGETTTAPTPTPTGSSNPVGGLRGSVSTNVVQPLVNAIAPSAVPAVNGATTTVGKAGDSALGVPGSSDGSGSLGGAAGAVSDAVMPALDSVGGSVVAPLAGAVNSAAAPATNAVNATVGPAVNAANDALLAPALDVASNSIAPALSDLSSTVIAPTTAPVTGVINDVSNVVSGPIAGAANATLPPLIDTAGSTIVQPVADAVTTGAGNTIPPGGDLGSTITAPSANTGGAIGSKPHDKQAAPPLFSSAPAGSNAYASVSPPDVAGGAGSSTPPPSTPQDGGARARASVARDVLMGGLARGIERLDADAPAWGSAGYDAPGASERGAGLQSAAGMDPMAPGHGAGGGSPAAPVSSGSVSAGGASPAGFAAIAAVALLAALMLLLIRGSRSQRRLPSLSYAPIVPPA